MASDGQITTPWIKNIDHSSEVPSAVKQQGWVLGCPWGRGGGER